MGGGPLPHFFCTNLLVRVNLGYPPNFNFLGKPLLVEKYVEGKEKERIMPSLVATTSSLAFEVFKFIENFRISENFKENLMIISI